MTVTAISSLATRYRGMAAAFLMFLGVSLLCYTRFLPNRSLQAPLRERYRPKRGCGPQRQL